MKKLLSSLSSLILGTFLVMLFGHVAIASAHSRIAGEFFVQPRRLLLAEASNLTLTNSNTFTIYLSIIYAPPPFNPKKGIGVRASPACTDSQTLKASWYLNWSVYPDPTCGGVNNKFVPRISGAGSMSLLSQAIANAQNSGWLIGFSEPNLSWQNGLSPAQGAVYWKQIEEAAIPTGIKLVSPSPNQYNPGQADPYGHQWLWAMVDAYKAQNGGQSPHFDAIGWNIYKQTAGEVKGYLNARRNEALSRGYNVPIWVLEYGGECWNSANGDTGNKAIMTTITAWFNATPWIERYAWFANRITGTEPNAIGWQSCSLINSSTGTPTSLGQIYAGY
jgi:hypothetical protein